MHILLTEQNIREFLSEAALTLADCDDIDIAIRLSKRQGS